ncbi:Protein of unknown function [Gryllus bimaculatus]|nr:Protein of unknown function [Gryllus bimaculatus]
MSIRSIIIIPWTQRRPLELTLCNEVHIPLAANEPSFYVTSFGDAHQSYTIVFRAENRLLQDAEREEVEGAYLKLHSRPCGHQVTLHVILSYITTDATQPRRTTTLTLTNASKGTRDSQRLPDGVAYKCVCSVPHGGSSDLDLTSVDGYAKNTSTLLRRERTNGVM